MPRYAVANLPKSHSTNYTPQSRQPSKADLRRQSAQPAHKSKSTTQVGQRHRPSSHVEQHGNSGGKKKSQERRMGPGGKRANGAKAKALAKRDAAERNALAKRDAAAPPKSTASSATPSARLARKPTAHSEKAKGTTVASHKPAARKKVATQLRRLATEGGKHSGGGAVKQIMVLAALALAILPSRAAAQSGNGTESEATLFEQFDGNCTAAGEAYASTFGEALFNFTDTAINTAETLRAQQDVLATLFDSQLSAANVSLSDGVAAARQAIFALDQGDRIDTYNILSAAIAASKGNASELVENVTTFTSSTFELAANRTQDYFASLRDLCGDAGDLACILLNAGEADIASQFTGPGATGELVEAKISTMTSQLRGNLTQLQTLLHSELFPTPNPDAPYGDLLQHIGDNIAVLKSTADTLFSTTKAGVNDTLIPNLHAVRNLIERTILPAIAAERETSCLFQHAAKEGRDAYDNLKASAKSYQVLAAAAAAVALAAIAFIICKCNTKRNSVAPATRAPEAPGLSQENRRKLQRAADLLTARDDRTPQRGDALPPIHGDGNWAHPRQDNAQETLKLLNEVLLGQVATETAESEA